MHRLVSCRTDTAMPRSSLDNETLHRTHVRQTNMHAARHEPRAGDGGRGGWWSTGMTLKRKVIAIHTNVFEFPLREFCKRYVSCPRFRVKIIIAMTYDVSVEWRRGEGIFIMTMVAAVITMANQLTNQQEQARHRIPGNRPFAGATRSPTIINRAQALG